MGFFSNNEAKDLKQTQEIKEVASSNQQPPALDLGGNMQNNNNMGSQQSDFVNPFSQNQMQQPQQSSQMPTPPPINSQIDSMPQPQSPPPIEQNPFAATPQQQPSQSFDMNQSNQQGPTMEDEKIQELIVETVEKIIDEKWETITSSVESVITWKDNVEKEIDLLKQDIVHIKEGFEQFEKRLLNKVNSYDRNILDVNSEIKALEKVFNKITPTLVNNVNELSKIAQDLKGVKKEDSES